MQDSLLVFQKDYNTCVPFHSSLTIPDVPYRAGWLEHASHARGLCNVDALKRGDSGSLLLLISRIDPSRKSMVESYAWFTCTTMALTLSSPPPASAASMSA